MCCLKNKLVYNLYLMIPINFFKKSNIFPLHFVHNSIYYKLSELLVARFKCKCFITVVGLKKKKELYKFKV